MYLNCEMKLLIVFQDNLFEWHFTFRGPSETDFEGREIFVTVILT